MPRATFSHILVVRLLGGLLGPTLPACLPGCQDPAVAPSSEQLLARSPGQYWLRTELFFGLTRRDRTPVAAEEFLDFLDKNVTPQFPDGLTTVSAEGRYFDSMQALHQEPSRLVVLMYPPARVDAANRRIEAITAEYIRRFDQESVLRVDSVQKAALLFGTRAGGR